MVEPLSPAGSTTTGTVRALDTVELFESGTGEFTIAGRMSSARMDPFAIALGDESVLIAGGFPGYPGPYLASAELFC